MNILSINYEDLAGLSYNLCTAINELTDHYAISISIVSTWIRYPTMVAGKQASRAKLPALMKNADVIHINERPGLLSYIGGKPEDCQDKQIIFHALGSRFRRRYPRYLKALYSDFPQAKVVVATPNLLPLVPDATWFPSIIPIECYREEYLIQRNDPPLLYASHTKPNKHRPILITATDDLWKEGLVFERKWVGGKVHKYNLKWKARADIYLNGMKPFYGVDVLEASAFEMPSVTGMSEFAKEYVLEYGIDHPYMVVNDLNELKDAIRQLILDRSFREEKGKRAYEYVKEMHSPEVGVRRFLDMIE